MLNFDLESSLPSSEYDGEVKKVSNLEVGNCAIAISKILDPKFEKIPSLLVELPRWVLWRCESINGRSTKIPKKANKGNANVTDPSTWLNFSAAQNAYQKSHEYFSGVGFVLDGKPLMIEGSLRYLIGLDFDQCITDFGLDPAIQEIRNRLDTYCEISPSGTGIRMFVLSNLLVPAIKRKIAGKSRELYSNQRYLTVTGRGEGEIRYIHDFEKLLSTIFPDQNISRIQRKHQSSPELWQSNLQGGYDLQTLNDELKEKYLDFMLEGVDVGLDPNGQVERCRRLSKRNDVDYAFDKSSADIAMVSMLAHGKFSADEIEKILRATRYRPKFDEKRGAQTYIEKTINHVCSQNLLEIQSEKKERHVKSRGFDSESLLRLNSGLIAISDDLPPTRDYVSTGMIMGKVYVFAGFGGAGKTQLAMQIALDIACGGAVFDRNTKEGSVLMVLGEEDKSEIDRRVNATIKEFRLDKKITNDCRYIRMFGLVGKDVRLTSINNKALELTHFVDEIIDASRLLAEATGRPTRAIFLDHLGLLHGGDFNAREDASLTMRASHQIAQETGAAVVLMAHSPKNAQGNEESTSLAIAGSTAFVDQARGAFVLAGMRDVEATRYGIDKDLKSSYVSLTTVKNNYGPSGTVEWFKRQTVEGYGVSVLVPTELTKPIKNRASATNLAQKIVEVVRGHRGEYSKTKLRDYHSGKNSTFGASKNEVERATAELLQNGQLKLRSPSPDECKKFGFSQQVRQVLDLPND